MIFPGYPPLGSVLPKAGRYAAIRRKTHRETASGSFRRTAAGTSGASFRLLPGLKNRDAFSILEVILALAILTGAMAVLGELGRLGFRNAKISQDNTKAQLLCESKMAELTSGLSTPQPVSGVQFDSIDQDSNVPWTYSVDLNTIDSDGMLALRIAVTQNLPSEQHPTTYALTRWILDPTIFLTSTSTTTSGTSDTGSGTTTSQ